MKALITGITGFVGSHLADYLLDQDVEVFGLTRWRSPKENISHCLDRITLCHGDLLDFSSLYNILDGVRPDFIFHLAAQSVVEEEFIPILKSHSLEMCTFGDLWDTCKKRNKVREVKNKGIMTQVIDLQVAQLRAISFFNGMGNWLPIKQISRHKYKGKIVELRQKFGSVRVTPNHCVIDKFGKLCSADSNPDLLPIRKLNYYNQKQLQKIRLIHSKKHIHKDGHFNVRGVEQKKLPLELPQNKLKHFVRFCAAYITEGCAHSRAKKRNFTVTISNTDKEWLEDINKSIKSCSFGMGGKFATIKKKGYKDVHNMVITSELLYDVMVKYCGQGSRNKCMPDFIFQLSRCIQEHFLETLAEGDGCYQEWKKYKVFRYTTSSRKLASQVCLLLMLLGRDYTVYQDDNDCFFIRECKYYQPSQGTVSKKIKGSSYDGYVYDISVGEPDVFAAGVGSVVLHNSYVPYSFTAPASTLDVNCIGSCNLLESIRILHKNAGFDPVVHVCSSSECYGQVLEDEIPIKETNAFRPASPYAVSKIAEDMLAFQYWLSWGIKIIRTRLFTHSGPRRGDVFVVSNFAKQIALIEKGKQMPELLVGNLDSVRTFMDVRDAVRAYWMLVNVCPPGEVYNIGGDTTMTVGEMLNKLLSLSTRSDIVITVDPQRLRPSDVTLQIPDSSKFKLETGWKPKIDFDQTLTDTLEYWRKKYE